MTTWIEDQNGNKCSVEYFRSVEAAQKALDSLSDCKDCINCADSVDCSGCVRCSGCSGCLGCFDCSYCFDCSDCSYCFDCSDCSDCYRCYRCSCCSDCSDCLDGSDVFTSPPIPRIDDIHKRVFEAASAVNALDMIIWHTCETTHCRAGWVVHLAGEAGYALEKFHNTALAAQLIYRESGYEINPCKFYVSNEEALKDMAELAGVVEIEG